MLRPEDPTFPIDLPDQPKYIKSDLLNFSTQFHGLDTIAKQVRKDDKYLYGSPAIFNPFHEDAVTTKPLVKGHFIMYLDGVQRVNFSKTNFDSVSQHSLDDILKGMAMVQANLADNFVPYSEEDLQLSLGVVK